eukprot:6496609-Ditylum_brightwellii.AAC.1
MVQSAIGNMCHHVRIGSCCVIAFGFVDDGSITVFLVGRIHNEDDVVLVVDDNGGGGDDAWDSSSTSRIAFLANAM